MYRPKSQNPCRRKILRPKFSPVGTRTIPIITRSCTFYSTANTGPRGPSDLFTLNPSANSSNPTLIGPLDTGPNTNATNAMDFLGTTLYGISSPVNLQQYLFTINTTTGQASTPIPITYAPGTTPSQVIHALRFFGGTAYVIGSTPSAVYSYTLNLSTGVLTQLGTSGIVVTTAPSGNIGNGMYVDPQGNLFITVTNQTSLITTLYLIDKATGTGISQGTITFGSSSPPLVDPRINELVYDPCTGTVYASVVSGTVGRNTNAPGNTITLLGVLSGNTVTIIGPTPDSTNAFAIRVTTTVTVAMNVPGVTGCKSCYFIQPPPSNIFLLTTPPPRTGLLGVTRM